MKIEVIEPSSLVYSVETHQVVVKVNGVQYTIRVTEDDNGCEYRVLTDSGWKSIYEVGDSDLQSALSLVADYIYDLDTYGETELEKDE